MRRILKKVAPFVIVAAMLSGCGQAERPMESAVVMVSPEEIQSGEESLTEAQDAPVQSAEAQSSEEQVTETPEGTAEAEKGNEAVSVPDNPIDILAAELEEQAKQLKNVPEIDKESALKVDTSMIRPLRENAGEGTAGVEYLYAVLDKNSMSDADIAAVEKYLNTIAEEKVLIADVGGIGSAGQLYTLLQADAIQRDGIVKGVQIFGKASVIPSFEIQYVAQMEDGVDEVGSFLTDLFYGNFSNRAEDITQSYSVKDHFENNRQIWLVPEWAVARLPLGKGEFAPFLERYEAFRAETDSQRLPIVNFSNPIFKKEDQADNMGYFLRRMQDEFGLLDCEVRYYGNTQGQYAIKTEVLGDYVVENLKAENEKGIAEFLINSHGMWDGLEKSYHIDGKEYREVLIDLGNINKVMGTHPYYLDLWSCDTGYGMEHNLVTTAMTGNCMGAFADTTIIANNGVKNAAALEEMPQSNFYYFYLHYLKAMNEGKSRGEAFFIAQKHYGNALMVHSQGGIVRNANYQFNLYNLLGYHNFGLL